MKTIMKRILTYFSVFAIALFFIFCDTPQNKNDNAYLPPSGSTLDSLQGNWISSKDSMSKLVITGNNMVDYYQGTQIDASKFFLADVDTFPSISSYDTTQLNGKYLITYTPGYAGVDLKYRINYLSDSSLELVYDNKYMPFTRK